jgi:hypothetical protein
MRITIAELRKVVESVMLRGSKAKMNEDHESLPSWNGMTIGDWLTLDDGTVVQLKRLMKKAPTAERGELVTAYVSSPYGHGWEQRADVVLKNAQPATDDEIADVKHRGGKYRSWLSGEIDTSHEGT